MGETGAKQLWSATSANTAAKNRAITLID